MNQTQKRLSIIKLAISIGDTETIQLQILKLAPLKGDEKIQEIIRGLQAENYAQTQALITSYIETPPEEIHQRTMQHEPLTPEEEEEIIEEFDLFRVKSETQEDEIEEILDLEGIQEAPQSQEIQSEINYDALLNLKSEDILADNIAIKEKHLPTEDDFFDVDNANERYDYTEVIEKDDFFHALSEEREEDSNSDTTQALSQDIPSSNTQAHTEPTPSSSPKQKPIHTSQSYESIPYIDQKLKHMMTQYPPIEPPKECYPSVDAWLIKIGNEGYTEREVEEMMKHIRTLSENGRVAEAAQLLLISAATQSKFAQFMLARSLFKGDLLKKNLPEAFTLINRLAMDDDYPEAICDLGQLYEYGIGIDKDMVRAEALYKEAMELGIQRAAAHYKRVHQANKSLFAKLFRR